MSRLYQSLATYYDLIYHERDYKAEAQQLKRLIATHCRSGGKELLDVACGTGAHLQYLTGFRRTGTDVNDGMLAVARQRLPKIPLHKADMRTLALRKEFDVLLCLFSSIGYVRTLSALRSTLRRFAHHLTPGGLLIIEPWLTPDAFTPDKPFLHTFERADLKIARVSHSRRRGRTSLVEMQYLIAERGTGVAHAAETHTLGLFTHDETRRALEAAGLKPRFLTRGLQAGRGLFIAVKPL